MSEHPRTHANDTGRFGPIACDRPLRKDHAAERELAHVIASDYVHGSTFIVRARLGAATTVDMLTTSHTESASAIGDPVDYFGYAVAYLRSGTSAYSFLFSEALLAVGKRYGFVGQATVFTTDPLLISTPVVSEQRHDGGHTIT